MKNEIHLKTPLNESQMRQLNAGQVVFLEGTIYSVSGIDAHKRLIEYSKVQKSPPADLNNTVIIHAPAFCQKVGAQWKLVYLTVTTSARMNFYEPALIECYSLHGVIGKGGMDDSTHTALSTTGGVYLAQVGGCNAYYLPKVEENCEVYWEEFSPFPLVKLNVHDYGPLIVAMDTHGVNLYKDVKEESQKRAAELLSQR